MLFNSAAFAVFFPIVTTAYFVLPHRARWGFLLVASSVFYMAFIPEYIAILALLIGIDYGAGLWIERSEGRRRLLLLIASLSANIAVLAVFKYYNFFVANIATVAQQFGMTSALPVLSVVLPIGLSFHTFQAMAYTIGVYRREVPAERHLGVYALYVMFYPQLVAGPIERPQNLIPQLHAEHHFDGDRVANGLRLMAWGLFKKVVIADRLALIVDIVFENPAAYDGPALLVAVFFFSWQIYCDFSGYSDMAIGAAEVMGFRLMTNFRRPYLATSVRDFWRRWHISLSTWFRDFVYVPLGGNQAGMSKWALVVLVTFVLSGFWHGANWTFIAWGALNGGYLILGRATTGMRAALRETIGLGSAPRLERAVQVIATFSLVAIGWVIFRAPTLSDAGVILRGMIDWRTAGQLPIPAPPATMVIAAVLIGALVLMELLQNKDDDPRPLIVARPAWVRWSAYYALILSIVVLGMFKESAFIYFQF